MKRPYLAIIGRPNVGKSTLFNRLIGKRVAIVENEPGVTRDRNYHPCVFAGKAFTLIDTGGLDPSAKGGILSQIREQTRTALDEADILLVLLDGQTGPTPIDEAIVQMLRTIQKPIYYLVNKIDSAKAEPDVAEFYRLGITTVFAISAEHGRGIDEAFTSALAAFGSSPEESAAESVPSVAIVGRPNVGKSTLINTILGQDRLLTSDIPGTTRDTIDTRVEFEGKVYRFIDTAGIRRRGKQVKGVESYSVGRATDAIRGADLSALLIDAREGITEQDTKIAGKILEEGKACVIVANKWDLLSQSEAAQKAFHSELIRRLPFLTFAPVLKVSALKGKGIRPLFRTIDAALEAFNRRIPTGELNAFLRGRVETTPPPSVQGRFGKLLYVTQASVGPPTVVIFARNPLSFTRTYLRFLENQLREGFGFVGTPIRFRMKTRPGRSEPGRGRRSRSSKTESR